MKIIPRLDKFNPNFYYLLKKDIDYAVYIEDKKTLFVNEMNKRYAKKLFKDIEIRDLKEFYSYVKKEKPKKILLDFKGSDIMLYKKLNKIANIEDYGKVVVKNRVKKTHGEVKNIRKAVRISKEIFEEIEKEIKKGNKEEEIKKSLLIKMHEKNVEPSFSPIVADLSNAKYPHYITGKKRINKGVLIDFGVKWKNYCSDLTRTMIFDKNGKEFKKYEKIKEIFYELVDELSNMETAEDVAVLSKKLFKKHKIPHPPHLIGHGIGLEVHELPYLRKGERLKIENTTLAIEPAYYREFGLRYEEDIYIKKSKVDIL